MNILPKQSPLGTLRITEIYEFYNIPALFLSMNRTGQTYIATWVDEYEDRNVWLYASVSDDLLPHIRNGEVDLCDIFTGDKQDSVYLVTVYYDEKRPDEVVLIQKGAVDPDMAPLPDYYIDLSLLPPIVWEGIDQRNDVSIECDNEIVILGRIEDSDTVHSIIDKPDTEKEI